MRRIAMKDYEGAVLILLCAPPVRVAVAQTVAKENAGSGESGERDGVIAGRIVNDAGGHLRRADLVIKAGVKIMSGMQRRPPMMRAISRRPGLVPVLT